MREKELRCQWLDGRLCDGWKYMGAHVEPGGVRFTLYAPHAAAVRVSGEWCRWGEGSPMEAVGDGFWSALLPQAREGDGYKYILTHADGSEHWKADPFALAAELRPGTASRVRTLRHDWKDGAWMERRRSMEKGRNIYEVHPGSWRRHPDGSYYSWSELGDELIPYALEMGYTHIELLPVMEHPLDASWGYQVTGFFAATARYGEPEGLMELLDRCHQSGLGVILDWVPGHFCRDSHGLGRFDGTALYEGADHPQWGTYRFNFASGAVRSFLLSSAFFGLGEFHADGLRVDGVSSMHYLNFGLGEDDPRRRRNAHGGEEDEDAVAFLRQLNTLVGQRIPGVFMVAEESSAWPMVTMPPELGGLGFHYKWDMGWMNDTLRYMETDFPWRGGKHGLLNFSMVYAFSENFILPLSHDEVVHGKKSLIGRMPGDWWRQFAGMRLLWLYTLCHPGDKLCFMGGEFGQFIEWREYEGLEWFLLDYDTHRSLRRFVREANALYRRERSLWAGDGGWEGFRWLDADDAEESILAFRRIAPEGEEVSCVLHFTPETRKKWRLGVPEEGEYEEIFSSDDPVYGGSGQLNPQPVTAERIPRHGMEYSVEITVPPVGGTLIRRREQKKTAQIKENMDP